MEYTGQLTDSRIWTGPSRSGRIRYTSVPMPQIHCELRCHSNSLHLQQLFTGFDLLRRQGAIDLTWSILRTPPASFGQVSRAYLLAILNREVRVLFDMSDSSRIEDGILPELDCYFKRSFEPSCIGDPARRKVRPLGLNCLVYEGSPSTFAWHRAALEPRLSARIQYLSKAMGLGRILGDRLFYAPRVDNCSAPPDYSLPARALFMTRVWNPAGVGPDWGLLGFDKAQLESLNEMRVACIRMLRKEFGQRFSGGLAHSNYAIRYFRDCLVDNNRLTEQKAYLQVLRHFPIGVATTGLFDSVGWKFAEYLCRAKAIVAEKLHFASPGLTAGQHYLEFTTPDRCVQAVARLLDDDVLRAAMMTDNSHYYMSFLRPDMLVSRALATALSSGR